MKNAILAVVFLGLVAIVAPVEKGFTADETVVTPLPNNMKGTWWRADSVGEIFNPNNQRDRWALSNGKIQFHCQRGRTDIKVNVSQPEQSEFTKLPTWRLRTDGQFYDNRCEINYIDFWQENGKWVGRADASPFYPHLRAE